MTTKTTFRAGSAPALAPLAIWLRGLRRRAEAVPYDLIAIGARIFPAAVFWQSGLTKLDEHWRVSDNAVFLFQEEYRLPLLDPWLAAHAAATAELTFPILLVLGLATRLSALALLGMTMVIEIFVYPDAWPTHGTWATLFLLLVARGPGRFSLDHLLGRLFCRSEDAKAGSRSPM